MPVYLNNNNNNDNNNNNNKTVLHLRNIYHIHTHYLRFIQKNKRLFIFIRHSPPHRLWKNNVRTHLNKQPLMSPVLINACMEWLNFGAKTFSKQYLRGEMRIHLFIELWKWYYNHVWNSFNSRSGGKKWEIFRISNSPCLLHRHFEYIKPMKNPRLLDFFFWCPWSRLF